MDPPRVAGLHLRVFARCLLAALCVQLYACRRRSILRPLEHIEADYLARAKALGIPDGGDGKGGRGYPMDFDMVMPASHLPRRDKYEQMYSAHFTAQGLAEPTTGRPIWDLGQNAIRGVSKSKYSPTMLPKSILWSSLLKRPATCEEHALHQGIVLGRTDASLWCIEMH